MQKYIEEKERRLAEYDEKNADRTMLAKDMIEFQQRMANERGARANNKRFLRSEMNVAMKNWEA